MLLLLGLILRHHIRGYFGALGQMLLAFWVIDFFLDHARINGRDFARICRAKFRGPHPAKTSAPSVNPLAITVRFRFNIFETLFS